MSDDFLSQAQAEPQPRTAFDWGIYWDLLNSDKIRKECL